MSMLKKGARVGRKVMVDGAGDTPSDDTVDDRAGFVSPFARQQSMSVSRHINFKQHFWTRSVSGGKNRIFVASITWRVQSLNSKENK